METLGCGKCGSPGHNRSLTADELRTFWLVNGVDGMAPEGLAVRSVTLCSERLNLPGHDVCGEKTAWVRKLGEQRWRPLVQDRGALIVGSR